jgi:aldehyde:ferredoxin oxidoreductase
MECFEKGLITTKDTDGIKLNFGNSQALLQMIEKIVRRDGFGDLLAEGSYRAAKKIGKGAERFSMTSKKQEFPAHEPRGKWGVGLQYAVSSTGGDHLVTAHDTWFELEPHPEKRLAFIDISDMNVFGIRETIPATSLNEKKVQLFSYLELLWSLNNVIDLCIFVAVPEYRMMTLEEMINLINYVTGWDISFWETMKISEKGINMARLFNVKHGKTYKDDNLPERFFEPLENGPLKGMAINREEFNKALKIYYQIRGWSSEGIPTYGKFVELGIEDLYKEAFLP